MNPVNYLRISVVDRCNFHCRYCMPDQGELGQSLAHYLSAAELIILVQDVFVPLGFNRFRLTGGEPLLRPDLVEIVQGIAASPGVEDVSMTTNGMLLASMAQDLHTAGLRRINISLDSLDPTTFAAIINRPSLSPQQAWQAVWNGIQTAHRIGFSPLKLNVVVIPGVNDHEVLDLAALSIEQDWHVRFIEFMPIGNLEWFSDRGWVDSAHLRQQIQKRWGLAPGTVQGSGPADIFQIPGAKGTLGFISQMSECFCDRCNRMRLSADGWLRPCLLNETGQINLREALRSHQSLTAIQAQVATVLTQKPDITYKQRESGTTDGIYSRTMSRIGG
jgi:cyclic pyranopterin phosphate synthase